MFKSGVDITFRQKVRLLTSLRNKNMDDLEKVQTTKPATSRVVELEKVRTATSVRKGTR